MIDSALVPFDAAHDTTEFECGKPELNAWLQHNALRATTSDTARVYVWVDGGSVLAYVAIAPTQVRRDQVPRSVTGGVSVIPAYLIAKLAIDRSLQGRGTGSRLLVQTLRIIVRASADAGGRLIVVDALDADAHSFYRHHDFQPIGSSNRLVMKVSTAREAIGGS